ncbi:MAG TPA: hypothetical protein VFM03_00820 [Candidatus Limnocylindria bacterium]|jgi:hypothetical protein|nr:hypothetical protein [Candidatus Limnocylindria bacterium]
MHLLAYIDPGSGSMLLQVLLAGVLAIPFFFRRVIGDAWHRIRGGSAAPEEASTAASGEETDSRG